MNTTAPVTLLGGAPSLARWILAGGRSPLAPAGWRMQLRWRAWWFERLARLQSKRIAVERPKRDPVLVLGFWRSGTTLLHERLAAMPNHQSPRTWQCFNPSTFVLTGTPKASRHEARRPMDDGRVSADSAQEDEFAILLQGAPSLYRGFIDPRRLDSLATELLEGPVGFSWQSDWLRFLAAVESNGGGRRLVLKSPNHALRLDVVERVFPNSLQVWIGRPLPSVWASNLRMWQAMFARYALWPCPEGVLTRFLARSLDRYVRSLRMALEHRGREHTCWIDYEDLIERPSALQHALRRILGVDRAQCTDTQLENIVANHPALQHSRSAIPLAADVSSRKDEIEHLHARARALWGWQSTD